MLIPHELCSIFLDQVFNLGNNCNTSIAVCGADWLRSIDTYFLESVTEPGENLTHVASFLHGDNSGVVLLIHPYQEGLLVVVPDTSSIRPVSSHP